jgi:hypothetical protein
MVGVGGTEVGTEGIAVGEAQADKTQTRRRVERVRMSANILE